MYLNRKGYPAAEVMWWKILCCLMGVLNRLDSAHYPGLETGWRSSVRLSAAVPQYAV